MPYLPNKRFVLPLALFAALFAALAASAHAQDFVPLAPIEGPGIAAADEFKTCNLRVYDAEGNLNQNTCLPKYLRTIYNIGVALAGLFVVFSIVRGGFTLMSTDSILGKLEGKKIILQALGGAVIVYSSWLLMNTINPTLASDLNLSLAFPRVAIRENPVELQPFFEFSAELDKLRDSLIAENKKTNIIDAKAAKDMARNASEEIRKINAEINKLNANPTENQSKIDELIRKRGEIDAERATLLRRAADADVLAAKGRIDLYKINVLNQLNSPTAQSPATSQAIQEIIIAMRNTATNDINEMNLLGLPDKAREIEAAFDAARADLQRRVKEVYGL